MEQVRPLKQVSEGVRERETFKYDPGLPITSRFNPTGEAIPGYELFTAGDVVLTALAQLGACQTGTERSLISLFDADCQHIIAEASPSQPLYPSLSGDQCGEQSLWLCGTSIPRADGVCELSLLGDSCPFESETEKPRDDILPLTLSSNLTQDPRFTSSPFCRPGSLAQFYAAVPIRTRRGINIGVYCVMDSTPGKPWTDANTSQLREISRTIMGHLESERLKDTHRRSERMNRGIASFIEGKRAVYDNHGCSRDSETTTTITQDLDRDDAQELSDDNISRPLSDVGSSMHVFSRAAQIIRDSVQVDGCFFFDATMESYSAPTTLDLNTNQSNDRKSTTSSSDESLDTESSQDSLRCSQMLGSATSEASDKNGEAGKRIGSLLPEKFLGKLLQRYPYGKVFNFGADGELQASDSSEDEQTVSATMKPGDHSQSPIHLEASPTTGMRKRTAKLWSRKSEGSVILKAFPTARSVAFVPIWDPKKERWFAGGFICTDNASRALTVLSDLSYLRAFGTLAMVEVLRYRASQADKAKSDVLGSLSHELRSPLHGILLSAELLLDTELDVFQGNSAHTIETCSRTLLDTIDHLLDFSKVNNFAGKRKFRKSEGPPHGVAGVDWKNFGKKSLFSNCQIDGLVEEVVESVFAGFTYQHSSNAQPPDVFHRVGSSDRMQIRVRSPTMGEHELNFANVSVFLFIDPHCDWMYCVQVGGFRRIIMNLFGNALKYTQKGSIRVSLTQETVPIRRQRLEHAVRFTVHDTGKGISSEFQQHGLFRPFSQEDTLAPGTGLGLSLVKRITNQMGGHIRLDSQVGVGTKVTVDLPLESLGKSNSVEFFSDDDREFEEWVRDLKGLRVKIVCNPGAWDGEGIDSHRKQLEQTCIEWLHMEVIEESEEEVKPDLVIRTHDSLPQNHEEIKMLAEAPNVVVCSNALEAYRQSQLLESQGHFGTFEFISQPAGPRKLAKTMLLAYRRWADPVRNLSNKIEPLQVQRPEGPKRTPSSFTVPEIAAPIPTIESISLPTDSSTSETEESIFSARLSPEFDRAASSNETLIGPSSSDGSSLKSMSPAPCRQFLLVDDNHINLKVLSAYMNKTSLNYDTAMNGQEAFDTFSKGHQRYACILMDISMPVMDGFEATRCIRAFESQHGLSPVCIIALSGLASEDAQREAFGSGMDLFLTKPVKLKALAGLLESRGLMGG